MDNGIDELLQDVRTPTEERQPQITEVPAVIDEAKGENKTHDSEIEKDEPISTEAIEAGADLSIGLWDFGQSSIFRFLVNRRKNKKLIRLYGENALDKLETLLDEQDAKQNNKMQQTVLREFTPQEMGMLRIARAVQTVTDDLPMSEEEKNLIKIPLMEIMKKKGGTLPPEYALIIGMVQIVGARVGELVQI